MAQKTPNLTVEHLKQLKDTLPLLNAEAADVFSLMADLPFGALDKVFPDDFSWAILYEIPARQLFLLFLAALGVVDVLNQKAEQTGDANQAVLDLIKEGDGAYLNELNVVPSSSDPDDFGDVRFGPNGVFSLGEFVGLVYAIHGQIAAIKKHGKYMSELVDDVRTGKEESFWKAIHVDRSIITCPIFSRRIAIATVQDDKEFFRLLGNALKTKWSKPARYLDDLRVLLQACHEDGSLQNMGMEEADRLFIQELKAYHVDGEEPQRSLFRFINRWKNNK